MRVTIHHIIETELAHFTVVRTKLIAALNLPIVDSALGIITLTICQLPILIFNTRATKVQQPVIRVRATIGEVKWPQRWY
jgi:hypothetical protein